MTVLQLEQEVLINKSVNETFQFFSDVANLERIMPPWLHFRVLSKPSFPMEVGTEIEYRLKLHGFPLGWVSRIIAWDPPHRFVDEQVRGPYRRWEHEHRFEPSGEGTIVRDLVRYAVLGGWVVDRLFVRRDIDRIFSFRRKKLLQILS